MILASLEMTRRVAGPTLPILAIVAIAYTIFGDRLPPPFRHPGVSTVNLVENLFLMPEGVYGGLTGLSLSIVFMFIAFGALVELAGGGDLLSRVITSLTRNTRGGPAKGAVVGSALFGAISGSGAANVFATGSITIPLMIRNGFKPAFAAAVEAVASQLGQLIPPVMGAAAFLVAEFARVPYTDVAAAAILPACLYVYAVYLATHFETERQGIGIYRGDPGEEIMPVWRALARYGHILIPLVVLIVMLLMRFSPYYAATIASISVLPVSFLRKETRLGLGRLLTVITSLAERIVSIAPILVTAGIIIAVLQVTGVPYAITSLIIDLGGGDFLTVLLIVALITIFLGFGLPVTAAFLVTSLFGAAALVELGLEPFTAYMYVFMFALLANITPPVCIATFAAASIAKTSFSRAGLLGLKIGLPAYVIPLMVAYNPILLSLGDRGIGFAIITVVTSVIGLTAMVAGAFGWLFHRTNIVQRVILLATAFAFLKPGITSDLAAAAGLTIVVAWQWFTHRRQEPASETAAAVDPGP